MSEKFLDNIYGSKVRYLEEGKGTPIIFISGWLGTSDNFIPLISILSKKFKCLALDMPGFGKSTPMNIPPTIKNYSQFLDSFVQKLDLNKFYLVGVSLGGTIALYHSKYGVNKAQKNIIQSPIFKPIKVDLKGKIWLGFLKFNLFARSVLFLSKYEFCQKCSYLTTRDTNIRSVNLDTFLKYAAKNVHNTDAKTISESAKDVLCFDFRNEIKDIWHDTLIIYGSQENLMTRTYIEELDKLMPVSHIHVIDGGSHFLMMQKPDIMAKAIEEFIQSKRE